MRRFFNEAVTKTCILLSGDSRTPEEKRIDAFVQDFTRRRREKRRGVTLPPAQQKFVAEWKANQPEAKFYRERDRAEKWKTAAFFLVWLLVIVWLLR